MEMETNINKVTGRPKGARDTFARGRRSIARRRKALVTILETADRSIDRIQAEGMLQAQDATTEFYKRAEQAIKAVADLTAARTTNEQLTKDNAELKAENATLTTELNKALDELDARAPQPEVQRG